MSYRCTQISFWAGAGAVCLTALLCLMDHSGRFLAAAIAFLLGVSTIWWAVAKAWWKMALIAPLAVCVMTTLLHKSAAGAGFTVFMMGLSCVIFTVCICYVDYEPSGKEWMNRERHGDAANTNQPWPEIILRDYDLEEVYDLDVHDLMAHNGHDRRN
jgi:hypothetical protein